MGTKICEIPGNKVEKVLSTEMFNFWIALN